MSIFSRLFHRQPKYQVSGYRGIYSALVTRLTRTGVHVGGTAGYPRIEIHSISEGPRQDKEGMLRQISLIVESISSSSLDEAVTMNEDNLQLLTEIDIVIEGWTVIGILPEQLTDMTEATDSKKILYRMQQQLNIWLQRDKVEA